MIPLWFSGLNSFPLFSKTGLIIPVVSSETIPEKNTNNFNSYMYMYVRPQHG